MAASVLLVGCGGLGGTAAELLVRAGVGRLRMVDPDLVTLSNIHRQILYTEGDAEAGRAKVEAAGARLGGVGGPTRLEVERAALSPENARRLARGVDLVVDGTDNLAARFLINDLCLDLRIPWIYGGISGTCGTVMPIIPGSGPCLRCLVPGGLPSADEERAWGGARVLNTIPSLVASIQVTEALKLLVGPAGDDDRVGRLLELDAWTGQYHTVEVPRASDCPACVAGRREFLAPDRREGERR